MIRAIGFLLCLAWASVVSAQTSTGPTGAVTSVTGQVGAVQLPTPCAQLSVPGSNTVTATATETPFGTTCVFPANTIRAGTGALLHVNGRYSSGVGESATGKVYFTNGTPNIATDTAPLNTGALSGIANASSALWWGDVWISFLSTTQMNVDGLLTFQAATNVQVPLSNGAPFTIDPTRDLTFYLSVKWSSNSASDSMQLRTMVVK